MDFGELKARLVAFGTKYDAMNRSFRDLGREQKYHLFWMVFGAVVMFVGMWRLFTFRSALVNWVLIAVGGMAIYFTGFIGFHDAEIDKLRRELWFIEHRLGLPHDPEELEDVEAYEGWLKERLRAIRGDVE